MKKLIVVKQLPVIEEQLKILSAEIDEKVEKAVKAVCTEETVKDVKNLRAEFNKDFKEIEEQRKTVKEQILAPYVAFEELYKTYISDKYKNADLTLKTKIDNVENELKAQKEAEAKAYFEEYALSKNIDFITWEHAEIKVGLSDSMKSLKEKAKAFIDKICDDLSLIETQEYKTEILVEYKQILNIGQAIMTVNNRMKAIEETKKQEEERKKTLEEKQQVIEKVEEVLSTPKVIEEKVRIPITTITVKNETKERLQLIINFLNEGGYDYE